MQRKEWRWVKEEGEEKGTRIHTRETAEKSKTPFAFYREIGKPGVMADTCNTSTQEAEAGDLKVPGQCGLHIDTLSQKEKVMIWSFRQKLQGYSTLFQINNICVFMYTCTLVVRL
jgi:hypothetical protein